MTKRCNNRVRSRGKLILNSYNQMVAVFAYIQASPNWLEWGFRTISLRQAEIKQAAGEVERVTRMVDGMVQTVGFREKSPTRSGNPTPTTLTEATLNAVSNRDGRLERNERMEVIKFIVWPLIGDTKAVCVRPPMTVADRRYAEKVMASGRLQVA
jgi:hypothetical protein